MLSGNWIRDEVFSEPDDVPQRYNSTANAKLFVDPLTTENSHHHKMSPPSVRTADYHVDNHQKMLKLVEIKQSKLEKERQLRKELLARF